MCRNYRLSRKLSDPDGVCANSSKNITSSMCAADSAPKVLLRRTRSSLHVRGDSKISAVNTYTCVILGIFPPAVCAAKFSDTTKPSISVYTSLQLVRIRII